PTRVFPPVIATVTLDTTTTIQIQNFLKSFSWLRRQTRKKMAPAKIESAGEISKRYELAGLVRARVMARRLALNAMARRMSTSMQDSLELFYPDLVPIESELLSPRNYLLAPNQPEDMLVPRQALSAFETRLYSRRLADMEAVSQDARDRTERLLDRYLTRSRARAAIMDGDLQNGESHDDSERANKRNEEANKTSKDNGSKSSSIAFTNRDEKATDEDEMNDFLEDAYENNYLDMVASTYDRPGWRRASRRLLRHRLLPYTLRPLSIADRLLARRGLLE
ncbi:hypothetical protein EGW08_002887, partial [Elysia chlorotica]